MNLLSLFLVTALGALETGEITSSRRAAQAVSEAVSMPSPNASERLPKMLVMHYTVLTLEETLEIFTQGSVSAHYTVAEDGTIYQHVDESAAAHHAGISFWHRASVNMSSIGIEIVNRGHLGPCTPAKALPEGFECIGSVAWAPFSEEQVNRVAGLAADVVQRYGIDPFDIVAHADVAPQRKQDPGPRFPWLQLARLGVGVAYDAEQSALVHGETSFSLVTWGVPSTPDVAWMQAKLADLGYAVPQTGTLDERTKNVLRAFHAHYLGRYDDCVSDEAMTVLQSLITWRNRRHGEL